MVYLADCVEVMRLMPDACVDVVFADPPYRLSGGVTVKSGRIVPVDKGEWDRSMDSRSESLEAFDTLIKRVIVFLNSSPSLLGVEICPVNYP